MEGVGGIVAAQAGPVVAQVEVVGVDIGPGWVAEVRAERAGVEGDGISNASDLIDGMQAEKAAGSVPLFQNVCFPLCIWVVVLLCCLHCITIVSQTRGKIPNNNTSEFQNLTHEMGIRDPS